MANHRDLSEILQGLNLDKNRGSQPHGRLSLRPDKEHPGGDFKSIRIVGLLRMASNGRDLQTPVILRYFKEPRASAYPMDLMEGFDSYVFPSVCHSNLVCLEKHMMQAKTNEGSGSSALTFCTKRSCLSPIFKLGLSKKERFTVFATKVHNRIYMMKKDNEFTADSKYPSIKIRVNTFADSPDMAADPERIANECEQTFAIYHAKFGKYELLYSGEVDGIKADEPVKDITDMDEINKCQFVRVRCGRFFWKMTNAWAQGYLSNSDHVYVATKDKANIVHQPLVRKTQAEIQQTHKLSPRLCCSYVAVSLDSIAEVMTNVNCPYTVYEFDFKFDGVDYSIEYKVHEDKNELSFLSEEFIKFLEK